MLNGCLIFIELLTKDCDITWYHTDNIHLISLHVHVILHNKINQ